VLISYEIKHNLYYNIRNEIVNTPFKYNVGRQVISPVCCDALDGRAIVQNQTYQLILILLTCRIWWASNKASRWQMGFNLACKRL